MSMTQYEKAKRRYYEKWKMIYLKVNKDQTYHRPFCGSWCGFFCCVSCVWWLLRPIGRKGSSQQGPRLIRYGYSSKEKEIDWKVNNITTTQMFSNVHLILIVWLIYKPKQKKTKYKSCVVYQFVKSQSI